MSPASIPASRDITDGPFLLQRSSGRGGAGNISRSRSRTPGKFFGSTPDSPRHSTGRGGAGNITGGPDGESVDEAELYRAHHEHDGMCVAHPSSSKLMSADRRPTCRHSTGRGGRANLTDLHSPPPEAPPHQHAEFEAIGRGGAGNMVRSRSHSRDPERRSVSRDRIAKVWQKITHHGGSAEGDIAEEGASADEGARAGVGE